MSNHDTLLTETIARHFDAAKIDGNVVDLGVAGLHIACSVNGVPEAGVVRSASLYFHLWGGALGDAPIFASMSGYGGSAEEAIVTGGCNWACAFGQVLRVALADEQPVEAERFEVAIHGRQYACVVDGLDRAMSFGEEDSGDVTERTRAARAHLGAQPWLLTRILESETLPALPRDRAAILSVFCWESAGQRILEVKVNGADWLPATQILDERPPIAGPGAALLREFAVLVPKGEPVDLSRDLLSRTLEGVRLDAEPRSLVGWAGWEEHGGQIGRPASEVELKRLEERMQRLPDDYRNFLLRVQAEGAGPGYGLLSPFGPAQAVLAKGTFDWEDGKEPRTDPHGVLALAHAGCGVMWLLVTSGPHRGEVWVDAAGSDALARRVAPSFSAWYGAWLDALVRDDNEFSQWDAGCCATPSVLSQMLRAMEAEGLDGEAAVAALPDRLGARAIGLASGGGSYFEQGDALSPCQPCSGLVKRLGLGLDVFKEGVPPKQARRAQ